MLNDKEYINWLKTTTKLINKYSLKQFSIKVKEMHPFDKTENEIKRKDMLYIKITDVHGIIIDNSTYDILEVTDVKD